MQIPVVVFSGSGPFTARTTWDWCPESWGPHRIGDPRCSPSRPTRPFCRGPHPLEPATSGLCSHLLNPLMALLAQATVTARRPDLIKTHKILARGRDRSVSAEPTAEGAFSLDSCADKRRGPVAAILPSRS